jgi:hypothetical protein
LLALSGVLEPAPPAPAIPAAGPAPPKAPVEPAFAASAPKPPPVAPVPPAAPANPNPPNPDPEAGAPPPPPKLPKPVLAPAAVLLLAPNVVLPKVPPLPKVGVLPKDVLPNVGVLALDAIPLATAGRLVAAAPSPAVAPNEDVCPKPVEAPKRGAAGVPTEPAAGLPVEEPRPANNPLGAAPAVDVVAAGAAVVAALGAPGAACPLLKRELVVPVPADQDAPPALPAIGALMGAPGAVGGFRNAPGVAEKRGLAGGDRPLGALFAACWAKTFTGPPAGPALALPVLAVSDSPKPAPNLSVVPATSPPAVLAPKRDVEGADGLAAATEPDTPTVGFLNSDPPPIGAAKGVLAGDDV